DEYKEIIAMRAAGIATKAVVADQLRQKNQLLGDLAWVGMNLADRADLRQWATLPQSFQVARVYLRPGRYTARAIGLNSAGGLTAENSPDWTVDVKPGQKTFLNWRSLL